jgi:hypothetical protein
MAVHHKIKRLELAFQGMRGAFIGLNTYLFRLIIYVRYIVVFGMSA